MRITLEILIFAEEGLGKGICCHRIASRLVGCFSLSVADFRKFFRGGVLGGFLKVLDSFLVIAFLEGSGTKESFQRVVPGLGIVLGAEQDHGCQQ